MNSARSNRLHIVVAALTRGRPILLAKMLQSWKSLAPPNNCDVTFLIVENDDSQYSRDTVEGVATPFFRPAYVLEPELGIPFGRNRAAKYGMDVGAALLIFMDDDEVADRDWLGRLVSGYRRSEAVLLGAPVRGKRPEGRLSWCQVLIFRGVNSRFRRNETRASRLADLESTNGVTIVTNNWLAEIALFAEHDIWFDTTMRFTGGTDTKFYHEVRSRGLTTGWVKDAYVYESISKERLSFVYQVKRARDQSSANLHRKMERDPKAVWRAIAPILYRSVILVALVLSVPLTLGRTLVPLARALGWWLGRIMTIFGYRSQLYVSTTGE